MRETLSGTILRKINPFAMVNCASQAFGGCEFWFHYTPNEADWQPFLYLPGSGVRPRCPLYGLRKGEGDRI
jgi:hypothetical protein